MKMKNKQQNRYNKKKKIDIPSKLNLYIVQYSIKHMWSFYKLKINFVYNFIQRIDNHNRRLYHFIFRRLTFWNIKYICFSGKKGFFFIDKFFFFYYWWISFRFNFHFFNLRFTVLYMKENKRKCNFPTIIKDDERKFPIMGYNLIRKYSLIDSSSLPITPISWHCY